MSYDIGVFKGKCPITTKEALQKYIKLCKGRDISNMIKPSRKIKSFLKELNENYPQIEDYNEEDVDNCPWSCMHYVSEGYVIMSFTYTRAEEMVGYIAYLARKYRLICVDPQQEKIWYAPPFEAYSKLNRVEFVLVPIGLMFLGLYLKAYWINGIAFALLISVVILEIRARILFRNKELKGK